MYSPSDLRQKYGEAFVLELPDGVVIPFRLLSLSDFFSYSKAISFGLIPKPIIEDEIFCKCVLDEVLIENIYQQKAGTPTVVADTILQYSAPQSLEELDYFFNYNRGVVDNVLYQIVNIICLAYSSYTPDDLFSKDIHQIMLLLSLAERKLLESGVITEPIDFGGEDQEPIENRPKRRQKKPKVDISRLKEEYDRQNEPEWNLRKAGSERSGAIRQDETPVFDDKDEDGNTLISGHELIHNLNTDPTTDSPAEKQMLEEAKHIFGDYLGKLQKGEKIKIKTEEERLEEARQRMEQNKRRFEQKINKGKK